MSSIIRTQSIPLDQLSASFSGLLSEVMCFSQYVTTSLISQRSMGSTLSIESIIYLSSELYLVLRGV
jgi:hypothetical protein